MFLEQVDIAGFRGISRLSVKLGPNNSTDWGKHLG